MSKSGRGIETDKKILASLKSKLPELEQLLGEVNEEWTYEDGIYRFYHHSFKVFYLQNSTDRMVNTLKSVVPDRDMNADFLAIIAEGTNKEFGHGTNGTWLKSTRPIVEAFFHARFFLEVGIKCAKEMDEACNMLPSSWAAFLYLYNAR